MLTAEQEDAARTLARQVVDGITWENQGGQPGYSKERGWLFSAAQPSLDGDAVNAAFVVLGEQPREIVSRGQCETCAHAVLRHGSYGERGYAPPCGSCQRPLMSNWEARA